MGLESANFIEELDRSWPLGSDETSFGDDHVRLVKHVLITQFPGANGNGFREAITASEQEINWLGGLIRNVQDQIDDLDERVDLLEGQLNAPAGTSLPFYNVAPPTGWTLSTAVTDAMMRVVNTSGGGSGGTDSPILNDKVPSHTHTMNSVGDHTHTYSHPAQVTFVTEGGGIPVGNQDAQSGLAGGHNHTINSNTGSGNWEPKYIDFVIGIKD